MPTQQDIPSRRKEPSGPDPDSAMMLQNGYSWVVILSVVK
jgi:hypothetical protein